jgi:hypothetical protein
VGSDSEKDGVVLNCMYCGKQFAPFFFYDEKIEVAWGDVLTIELLSRENPPGIYQPLLGISTYW